MEKQNLKSFKDLLVWQKASCSGYLLIELMIAMTIFLIGFMGVAGLVAGAQSTARVVADQFTANYLAMEGIEVIKSMVDENALQGSVSWNQDLDNRCYEVSFDTTKLKNKVEVDCDKTDTTDKRRLYFQESSGVYDYAQFLNGGVETPFYRMIKINNDGGGEFMKVESTVWWTGRGGADFEVKLEDYFFNLK